MEAKDRWVFRYLHYFGDATLEIKSRRSYSHRRISSISSKRRALNIWICKKQWRPMPVRDGMTAIIPGMQLQFISGNEVKALCHRVIATEESYVFGRYSVVRFIPIPAQRSLIKMASAGSRIFLRVLTTRWPLREFQHLFLFECPQRAARYHSFIARPFFY